MVGVGIFRCMKGGHDVEKKFSHRLDYDGACFFIMQGGKGYVQNCAC